jgi:hypothetical protein
MRTVHLPSALCDSVEKKYGARFGTLEEFLGYALRELVREDVARMDEEENRIVQERLRDLGYV